MVLIEIKIIHYKKSIETLEKIERAIKNEKLATLGTQDTILVLIYISVNKCMLSYKTLSVSTFMIYSRST
jgi:hypothetical protein